MSIVKKTQTGKRFLKKINTGADTGIVAAGGKFVDGTIPADAVYSGGNVGIDVQPTEKLSVQGVIESKTGGIKFPDATIQTTAAVQNAPIDAVLTKFSDDYGNNYESLTLKNEWTTPSKVSDFVQPITTSDAGFSPDDKYLAISSSSGTQPALEIYENLTGDNFTLAPNPSGTLQLNKSSNGVAWSPNGLYVAVCMDVAPYLYIAKRTGNTFNVAINTINNPPASPCQSVSWSTDDYLAVGMNNSPFFHVYTRSGDVFNKLANPTTLPDDSIIDLNWSPNNDFLACSIFSGSPVPRKAISVYQKIGTTMVRLADIPGAPETTSGLIRGIRVAWSPDSNFLALGVDSNGQRLYMYERSGVNFTDITSNIDVMPTADVNGIAWNTKGDNFAVTQNAVPYVVSYTQSGNVFTKTTDLPGLVSNGKTGTGSVGLEWSHNGKYFVNTNTSGFSLYKTAFSPTLPYQTQIVEVKDIGTIDSIVKEVVGITTVQRDALVARNGMVIYNLNTNTFNFYQNGAWVTGSGLI